MKTEICFKNRNKKTQTKLMQTQKLCHPTEADKCVSGALFIEVDPLLGEIWEDSSLVNIRFANWSGFYPAFCC